MKESKTLKEITEEWLQNKKGSIKESTYYRYVYVINQYIIPYFKDINMQELENYDFNIFIEELKKGLKPATIKSIVRIMKEILKYSKKKYEYIFNLDFYDISEDEKKQIHLLTKREKDKLEKYCMKNNSLRHIGIIMCLNTGLKIGEICALKWNCIDFDSKCIKVKKTMQRIYNQEENKSIIKIDEPNPKTLIRSIPISNKLYEILKPLKNLYSDNSFFLTGSETKFIEPRNYQKMLKKCLDDCKIEDYHFQNLRYQFANECINVGMDVITLIDILGNNEIPKYLEKFLKSSYNIKRNYLERL
ncbi:MAG: tyrosine-type recombinase/integrase family protein [Clostridia bacterium]|nr:tyrosine-type recombinase/integrase family protein [Clostridia bacterium]